MNPQNLTAAQFAWACCQAGDFPPPAPKRGPRFGLDAQCCLCGGVTEGVGWPRKLGIADTLKFVMEDERPRRLEPWRNDPIRQATRRCESAWITPSGGS